MSYYFLGVFVRFLINYHFNSMSTPNIDIHIFPYYNKIEALTICRANMEGEMLCLRKESSLQPVQGG